MLIFSFYRLYARIQLYYSSTLSVSSYTKQ